MRPKPAQDPAALVPEAFSATIMRAQQSMVEDGASPVGASIMPQDLDLPVESEATGNIPIERLSKSGKQVIISDSGEPAYGGSSENSQYELLEMLGRGGMGIVVGARQESLGREVAIKIARKVAVAKNSTTGGLIEQFANEACVTASLDHPNVIPVHTLARDPDGHLFFTMKKVSGVDWEQLLNPSSIRKPSERRRVAELAAGMNLDDQIEILMKVADAVAYAHSKKILHRDLKPENIMIGSFGEVLLMDWGLAMGFGDKNPYLLDPEKKPQLVGTPGYLAPEQATGRMQEFGPPTDIYQLGGILYRILTGHSPHWDKEVMAAVHKAARGEVTPPDEESDKKIDAELERIVVKALAPRPADRYQTISEFKADIKRYRANSESLAVAAAADRMLDELCAELGVCKIDDPRVGRLEKDRVTLVYTRLSECIGAFGQAINLWPENKLACKGRFQALDLQVRLAMEQGDLSLARSNLELLIQGCESSAADDYIASARISSEKLARRLAILEKKQATAEQREMFNKLLLWSFVGVLAVAIITGFYLLHKQKKLAYENLEATQKQRELVRKNLLLSEKAVKKAFAQGVISRAELLSRYMRDLEHTVSQYHQEAQRLMTMPADYLPRRVHTAAGRDGYYLDADYYDAATAPRDMTAGEGYGFEVSRSQVTVVLAAWARSGRKRKLALADAVRLARLDTLFSEVHHSRDDILWSLAGSASGVLASFPGSGRFRSKPDYDPTRRSWYLGSFDAPDDRPRWIHPHIDAGGQGLIISCTSRIRIGEQTLGVVGLEVSMRTIQEMISRFTEGVGGGARGLLVRQDGKIIVDTEYRADNKKWKKDFELTSIDELGRELSSYCRDALAGGPGSATAKEIDLAQGKKLIAHARLSHPDWLLVVESDKNAAVGLNR
ncbi:MAG TPA: serine/threonine protein kinase [Myxococcota bacterium]|nr:serine/threonine protein kinase [Myxococcota bacterium]